MQPTAQFRQSNLNGIHENKAVERGGGGVPSIRIECTGVALPSTTHALSEYPKMI